MSPEARLCAASFLISSFFHITLFYILPAAPWSAICAPVFWAPVLRFWAKAPSFAIAIRAASLGHFFGLGFLILVNISSVWMLGLYLMLLSNFHMSEYLFIAIYSRRSLSISSFMLNHSPQYILATVASFAEFAVELHFLPGFKNHPIISIIGLSLCLVGETLRKLAIATAGNSFSHIVEERKQNHHQLARIGVFRLCRHPSYLGWFLFAVGTQILLLNPLCTIVYAVVAWRMFSERVPREEYYLHRFFGSDYENYQMEVPFTGIPFVKGFLHSK